MLQARTEERVQAEEVTGGAVGVTAHHGHAVGRHSMTPELVSEEHLIGEHRPERAQAEDAEHAAPCQRLFPIFRPKSQWKVSPDYVETCTTKCLSASLEGNGLQRPDDVRGKETLFTYVA